MAQASADQRIVQSKRAVQIETLNAQAEVEPLNWLAAQLTDLRKNGPEALSAVPAQHPPRALRQGLAHHPGDEEMSALDLGSGALLIAFAAFFTFIGCFMVVPFILGLLRFFGFYVIVEERQCLVYVLFGKVRLIIDEPGLHFPMATVLGPRALIVNFFGDVRVVDLRLDQEYYRATPVNSEEGAPMGIGVWYEMWINDPVAYLFKNADPRGSLRTNVGNATVRNLSNMKLAEMLQERHRMSQMVRRGRRREVGRLGLRARQRLHPQGALPRRGHDPAD